MACSGEVGLFELPRQLHGSGRHLYRLTLHARLQRTRHGLVQLPPLRCMETTVQVFLKHDVPKAIVGEMAVSHVLDVYSSHQMVLPVEPIAQLADKALHVVTQHVGDDLSGEFFALDTGYVNERSLGCWQTVDPFTNDRLKAQRQFVPLQCRSLGPGTSTVLHETIALAHRAHELDCIQGMAFAQTVQFLSKSGVEPIRLQIQVGVHKGPALSLIEIDLHCAKASLEFAQYFLKRMALTFGAGRHFFRPVSADDQQRIAGQPLPEVKEEPRSTPDRPNAGRRSTAAGGDAGPALAAPW